MVNSVKFGSSGYELYDVQRSICENLARVVQTLDNAIHREILQSMPLAENPKKAICLHWREFFCHVSFTYIQLHDYIATKLHNNPDLSYKETKVA